MAMTNTERGRLYRTNSANATKIAQRGNVTRSRRKKEGRCLACGSAPAAQGRKYCLECREKYITHQKQVREVRKQKGEICLRCGKSAEVGTKEKLCLICWFKVMARLHTKATKNYTVLKLLWEQQEGRCAYTGEQLIPANTASVDHKIPVSRDGTSNISNLQWVSKRINSMKSDLTHDEFIALCRRIGPPLDANVGRLSPCVV